VVLFLACSRVYFVSTYRNAALFELSLLLQTSFDSYRHYHYVCRYSLLTCAGLSRESVEHTDYAVTIITPKNVTKSIEDKCSAYLLILTTFPPYGLFCDIGGRHIPPSRLFNRPCSLPVHLSIVSFPYKPISRPKTCGFDFLVSFSFLLSFSLFLFDFCNL